MLPFSFFTPLTKKIIYLFIATAVTFILYNPTRNAEFTNWDDVDYITQNADLISLNWRNLLLEDYQSNYHPLTMLSFGLEYSVAKLNPGLYHLDNILIHIINIVLVFWFIMLLTGNPESGFICSMLFAIHPLNVESVAWVSERKNVLYTLFFLSSLIAYLKYLKDEKMKFYYFSLGLFLLSLFAKGMAVSLSLTILAIDFLHSRSLFSKKVIFEKIPFFLLSLLFGLAAIFLQPVHLSEVDLMKDDPYSNPFYEKLLFGLFNTGDYLMKAFMPYKLAAFYHYPLKTDGVLPFQYYLVPLIVLLASVFFVLKLLRIKIYEQRLFLFAMLFFLLNIVFVLQILPVGGAIMADRYMYVPGLGIFMFISFAYVYIQKNHIKFANLFLIAFVFYCSALAFISFNRSKIWQSSLTLWSDQIEKYKNQPFGYHNRGSARMQLKDLSKSRKDFNKAIELDSSYYKAYYSNGLLDYSTGKYNSALWNFNKAISINKNYDVVYKVRAALKLTLADAEGALSDYSFFIKLNPDNFSGYYLRGLLFYHLNDYILAIEDFSRTLSLDPYNSDAYCYRSLARFASQDSEGALLDISTSLSLKPTNGMAHYSKAMIELSLGLTDEACADLDNAIKYNYSKALESSNLNCR